ncbi:MAG TPA: hypothetical protein VF757_09650 [Sphingomicrobium sp.]
MKISRDAALARMGRECAEQTRSSTASIEESTDHVLKSKAAVQRSLELLRDTATRARY